MDFNGHNSAAERGYNGNRQEEAKNMLGTVYLQVLKADRLRRTNASQNPDVAVQLCVRELSASAIQGNEKSEYTYGKSQWTEARKGTTDPKWTGSNEKMQFPIFDLSSAQVIVAVFDISRNREEIQDRFLGEVILNVNKLVESREPVRDDFVLKPTPFIPEVQPTGSITIWVTFVPTPQPSNSFRNVVTPIAGQIKPPGNEAYFVPSRPPPPEAYILNSSPSKPTDSPGHYQPAPVGYRAGEQAPNNITRPYPKV